MTTILTDNYNTYNPSYDIISDIKILGDLNNKLFCTFTDLNGLDELIEDIKSKYTIMWLPIMLNKLMFIQFLIIQS